MNKQSILAIATVLVLGLSIAVFAYQQTSGTVGASMSCLCCKDDYCPMKLKDTSGQETTSCCDNCDCCKGDSCPLKTNGDKTDAVDKGIHGVVVASSKTACDGSCCNHKDK